VTQRVRPQAIAFAEDNYAVGKVFFTTDKAVRYRTLRRRKLIAQAESLRKLLLVLIKVDQILVILGIFLVSSAHRVVRRYDDCYRNSHMPQTNFQPRLQIDHKQYQGRKQPKVLQQDECQVSTRCSLSSSERYVSYCKKEHIRQ
jgi:hypothetical protein